MLPQSKIYLYIRTREYHFAHALARAFKLYFLSIRLFMFCNKSLSQVFTSSESKWRWRFTYEREISKLIVSLGLTVADVYILGAVSTTKATKHFFYTYRYLNVLERQKEVRYMQYADQRYNRKIDNSIIYTLSEIPHSLVIDTWTRAIWGSVLADPMLAISDFKTFLYRFFRVKIFFFVLHLSTIPISKWNQFCCEESDSVFLYTICFWFSIFFFFLLCSFPPPISFVMVFFMNKHWSPSKYTLLYFVYTRYK